MGSKACTMKGEKMYHIEMSAFEDEYERKLELMSPEDKTKFELLSDEGIGYDKIELKVIEKKRIKPKTGDIFVLTFDNENYFYGKVLEESLQNTSGYKGCTLVAIFPCHTKELSMDNYKADYDKLLMEELSIVSSQIWRDGFFFTIGHQELTEEEKNLDIGIAFFCKMGYGFEDLNGNTLEHRPKCEADGLTDEYGISVDIQRSLLIDKSILPGYELEIGVEQKSQVTNSTESKLKEPFVWEKEHKRRYSVTVDDLEELQYIFEGIEDEPEGSGYDWEAIAKEFIKANFPDAKRKIKFDSEADMFYMYSSKEELLEEVITQLIEELEENQLKEYVMRAKFD